MGIRVGMRVTLLLLATLLAFAVGEITPETELAESYSPERVHAEAQESITTLLQMGKDDSACRNIANGVKNELKKDQRDTQKLVNAMDVGQKCHKAGDAEYEAAKKAIVSARNSYNVAKKKCDKAKNAKIQINPKSMKQLSYGCSAFTKSRSYRTAKRFMKNMCKDYIRMKGVLENKKKAAADVLKASKQKKVKCACRAKKNYKEVVSAANNFDTAENKKAWAKAHHMLCVLNGTPVSKCSVPRSPYVTAPSLPSYVAKTSC